jgi:hypothetical protein
MRLFTESSTALWPPLGFGGVPAVVAFCQVKFGLVLKADVKYHTSLKWAAGGESGVKVYPPKTIILSLAVSRTAECPSRGTGPLEVHCAEQTLANSASEMPRANEKREKHLFFLIHPPVNTF